MVEEPEELEARRKAAGVRKGALAERAGFDAGTYSRIVGGADPYVSTMRRLGSALSALIEEKGRHG